MVKAAILHEGPDKDNADRTLLKGLLTHLNLNADSIYYDGFGSKTNFFNRDNSKYSRLKQFADAGQIDRILFIVDADDEKDDSIYKGYDNTEQQLLNIIADLGFRDIADYYIVCDPDTKTGYLESLILATLPKEKKDCIDCFVKCAELNPKQIHKTIICQLYKIAYPDPPYNFDHEHFTELKAKLSRLFNKQPN